jgi:hypothetical protein
MWPDSWRRSPDPSSPHRPLRHAACGKLLSGAFEPPLSAHNDARPRAAPVRGPLWLPSSVIRSSSLTCFTYFTHSPVFLGAVNIYCAKWNWSRENFGFRYVRRVMGRPPEGWRRGLCRELASALLCRRPTCALCRRPASALCPRPDARLVPGVLAHLSCLPAMGACGRRALVSRSCRLALG